MTSDFAHLRERGLTQERVFSGHLLRIRVDTVILPNGEMASREIVEHPGAAAVVPLTPEGTVLLVRQFRYPIGETTLELPAGKLDPGEEAAGCAVRELREETGAHSGEVLYLGRMHPTPGCSDEVIHLFAARGFSRGEAGGDPDEFVEVVELTLDEALALIQAGSITDAKTVMGLLWLRQFGAESGQVAPVRRAIRDEDPSS